MMMIKRFDTTG
jgi:hypothetical protein